MKGDIVHRLRREGDTALQRHLSLGMWKLCAEAASEIERLRAVVRVNALRTGHEHQEVDRVLFPDDEPELRFFGEVPL